MVLRRALDGCARVVDCMDPGDGSAALVDVARGMMVPSRRHLGTAFPAGWLEPESGSYGSPRTPLTTADHLGADVLGQAPTVRDGPGNRCRAFHVVRPVTGSTYRSSSTTFMTLGVPTLTAASSPHRVSLRTMSGETESHSAASVMP